MSDTIFYKGKLKRGKSPLELFEKIKKSAQKTGTIKKWECTFDPDNRQIKILFGDDKSEDFILEFNEKGDFDGFCKVGFPMEGELFAHGKSEFKALLDVLYKAKSMFNSIEITDEYGLAESYWDSKRIQLTLRLLTSEEEDRVRRIYSKGYTTHERLLRAIMAEDMKMKFDDFCCYVNPYICCKDGDSLEIFRTIESYLYETAEYKKEGRLCEIPDHIYCDVGSIGFSVYAFLEGMSWIFFDGTGRWNTLNLEKRRSFSGKDAQVGLFFREKFAPLFIEETDSLKRCLLVYRYFVSVYDYLGFKFSGKV